MRPTVLTLIGKALSLQQREHMLWMLGEGELCGCEFAPRLGLDPSVVSRHLAALQRAGLIRSRREGVRLMWNLTDPGILRVLDELKELVREKEVVS